MSKEERFFQFPVAALRFNKPITDVTHDEKCDRLSQIIRYCVISVGWAMVKDQSSETVDRIAYKAAEDTGNEITDDRDRALYAGAGQLNVVFSKGTDVESVYREHNNISNLAHWAGNLQARLKASIIWEARDDPDWAWRDLATLAAVYAGIGMRKMSKLTYDRIGAITLGFNGQRERDSYKIGRYNYKRGPKVCKDLQLSDRQTQYTVERLKKRGWFVAASPNKRHVFYSHRLSLNELIDELASEQVKRDRKSASAVTDLVRDRVEQLRSMKTPPPPPPPPTTGRTAGRTAAPPAATPHIRYIP